MPATKITELTAISTVNTTVDPLAIVDVSDTTQASSGTTKKITVSQIDAAIFGASGSKAIVVDNVAALKALTVSGITDGQLYITRGYYSDNDGGQGTYIYDTASAATDDGGTVISPTAGSGRFLLQYGSELSVKQFGAKGDNVADDTTAIQNCMNAGRDVIFPPATYKVTATITIPIYKRIIGKSRTSTVINATTTNVVFQYLSPLAGGNLNAGLEINGLTINAKNAIQLNQSTNWASQAAVLGVRIINCTLFGTYNDASDPNANSNVYPTENELLGYGVGIFAANLYDTLIQSCLIRNFGIGVYFDACDLNNIDTCRLGYNARHAHLKYHDNTGSQNKIQNCDIIVNYRRGGIYDDKCRFTSIINNYFETYSLAAEHYTGRENDGTIFSANRVDASGTATPIISSAPADRGIEFSFNRGGNNNTIEILSTNWAPYNQELAKWIGNFQQWPETKYPQCYYDKVSSPRTWGPYSPKTITGQKALTYPWTLVPGSYPKVDTTGSTGEFKVLFDTIESDINLLISITGSGGATAGGYTQVKWGGTTVFQGDWFPAGGLITMQRTVRKPDAVLSNSGLEITLANNQGYFCGIEIESVNYQLRSSVPSSGAWLVGDQVFNSVPNVGSPKGWLCTASGSPGTWESTGNL
jgi:hypothetical protein